MKLIPDRQPFHKLATICLDRIDPNHHYLKSYPLLLQSTAQLCNSLGSDAIPVIAHLAYGWMPTILTFDFDSKDNAHLMTARHARNISSGMSIIQSLHVSPVNNSWVGLSKVLHFMNPTVFPIWDSKVAANFGISGHHHMKKKSMYLDYLDFVSTKLQTPSVTNVQSVFYSRVGYEITAVRACELILFTNSS